MDHSLVDRGFRMQVPPPDPRDPAVIAASFDEDEYPVTDATVLAAITETNARRAELGIPPVHEPTPRAQRMHADLEVIYRMMDRWGVRQVYLWAKNAARVRGYAEEK